MNVDHQDGALFSRAAAPGEYSPFVVMPHDINISVANTARRDKRQLADIIASQFQHCISPRVTYFERAFARLCRASKGECCAQSARSALCAQHSPSDERPRRSEERDDERS